LTCSRSAGPSKFCLRSGAGGWVAFMEDGCRVDQISLGAHGASKEALQVVHSAVKSSVAPRSLQVFSSCSCLMMWVASHAGLHLGYSFPLSMTGDTLFYKHITHFSHRTSGLGNPVLTRSSSQSGAAPWVSGSYRNPRPLQMHQLTYVQPSVAFIIHYR
jgi:hypothetical protein